MKLGWMHSAGKFLIPFGNALYLRASLRQFRLGRLEDSRIWEDSPALEDIYIDRRTFSNQVEQAKREGVKFLLVNVHSHENSRERCREFVRALSTYLYNTLPGVEIVITGPNEPMENVKLAGAIGFTEDIIGGIKDADLRGKVKVSAGNESSAFKDFWSGLIARFGDSIHYYDFHTSDSGSYADLAWLLARYRPRTPFINSEHFLWDLGMARGMDHRDVYIRYVEHLKRMRASGKVDVVMLQFPSLWEERGIYRKVALRLMRRDLQITKTSTTFEEVRRWWSGESAATKPGFIPDADWTLVLHYAKHYNIDPYLIAAMGKHETQWGTAGAGRVGYHLGWGVFSGSPYWPPGAPRSGEAQGLENQLKKGGAQIARDFKFPVTLSSCIKFARDSWKPAVPDAWGRSVFRIYSQIRADWIPSPPDKPGYELPEKLPDEWEKILLQIVRKFQEGIQELKSFIERY